MPTDDATILGDRYLLGEVVGRGGMADVYRATDQLLHRQVAVKVLRDTPDDESDRHRFTAEATTLARLNHVNLVMVLDAGVTAERPYLVMELVDGPTLGSREGPLPVEEVGRIGAQLADALAYAHREGVVHRDVKPGNVLLGHDGRARLADFGIARLIGDTVRHTRTGHAIGTPAYLSPEQVRGEEVTPAADVYSLGLVLLEALTGERAYPGSPTEAALVRLSRSPDVPDRLPTPWRDLLTRMTSIEPGDRPTAEEVATALGEPTPAPAPAVDPTRTMVAPTIAPSFIDRAGDAIARQPAALAGRARAMPPHQRGIAAAVVGILLLVVVAGIAADSGGTTDDLPTRTPPELEQPLRDLHDAVEGE